MSAAWAEPLERFEIQVPASIANLGPGFDTLAVAVQLYLRLCVRTIPGRGRLEFRFVGQELRGENYVERAFRFLARQNSRSFPSLVGGSAQRHSDARRTGQQRGRHCSRSAPVRGDWRARCRYRRSSMRHVRWRPIPTTPPLRYWADSLQAASYRMARSMPRPFAGPSRWHLSS